MKKIAFICSTLLGCSSTERFAIDPPLGYIEIFGPALTGQSSRPGGRASAIDISQVTPEGAISLTALVASEFSQRLLEEGLATKLDSEHDVVNAIATRDSIAVLELSISSFERRPILDAWLASTFLWLPFYVLPSLCFDDSAHVGHAALTATLYDASSGEKLGVYSSRTFGASTRYTGRIVWWHALLYSLAIPPTLQGPIGLESDTMLQALLAEEISENLTGEIVNAIATDFGSEDD